MKVVALVSGGKDSVFAMMECVTLGHEIIALANLHPADTNVDELDSYMFQTVAHNVVNALAECMKLPLFRAPILGSSVQRELQYDVTNSEARDEVEDMHSLLLSVQSKMSDVEAVCSGAILSTYQRSRVESVCERLGLVSLSFLWQREQKQLLEDMIVGGVKAVLVKVACMGLEPHRHLGQTLDTMQEHLISLADEFGCNVCGEGGEYESLVLDCPLFKSHCIELDGVTVMGDINDAVCPSGYLHIDSFKLKQKVHQQLQTPLRSDVIRNDDDDEDDDDDNDDDNDDEVDDDDDDDDEKHYRNVSTASSTGSTALNTSSESDRKISATEHIRSYKTQEGIVMVVAKGNTFFHKNIEAVMKDVLHRVSDTLIAHKLHLSSVCYVSLFVRDMNNFSRINAVYRSMFSASSNTHIPAARCCVELALPDDTPIILEAIATSSERTGLHVQSVSRWAPACIGPYSQATCFSGLLCLAGQIPLDASTMLITKQYDTHTQLNLCVQHCSRVLHAMQTSLTNVISITIYTTIASLHFPLESTYSEANNAIALVVPVRKLPRNAMVEMQMIALPDDVATRCKMTQEIIHSSVRNERYVVDVVGCRSVFMCANVLYSTHHSEALNVSAMLDVLQEHLRKFFLCWNDVICMRVWCLTDIIEQVEASLMLDETEVVVSVLPCSHPPKNTFCGDENIDIKASLQAVFSRVNTEKNY